MGIAVLILFYGSVVFSVVAVSVMTVKYLKAPLHLHWDLYQGSSVYELQEWWAQPQKGFKNKLLSTVLDVLFLREYRKRNRSFWYFLQTFHAGLYLLIIWHVWLFVSAPILNTKHSPGWGILWGHAATALVFIGALGILVKRITDKDLRINYTPIHYAKWVFMVICLAGGFYAVHFHFEGNIINVLEYVNEQLAFEIESKLHAPVATSAHLLIAAPWLIYLPFSHIMKLFLRYYHYFRWDEKPNLRGGVVEEKVKEALNKPISWSAPHIQSGKKWKEVASKIPQEGTSREVK